MAEKIEKAPPAAAKEPVKADGAKPDGVIVFNPFLHCWRCVNAAGRQVLSIGSKEAAMRAYPTYVVQEK